MDLKLVIFTQALIDVGGELAADLPLRCLLRAILQLDSMLYQLHRPKTSISRG